MTATASVTATISPILLHPLQWQKKRRKAENLKVRTAFKMLEHRFVAYTLLTIDNFFYLFIVHLYYRYTDSAFRQQRLKAWQPVLTPRSVLPTFFIIGVIFAPIGGVLFWASNNVTSHFYCYQ
jgi:hypothetical protein